MSRTTTLRLLALSLPLAVAFGSSAGAQPLSNRFMFSLSGTTSIPIGQFTRGGRYQVGNSLISYTIGGARAGLGLIVSVGRMLGNRACVRASWSYSRFGSDLDTIPHNGDNLFMTVSEFGLGIQSYLRSTGPIRPFGTFDLLIGRSSVKEEGIKSWVIPGGEREFNYNGSTTWQFGYRLGAGALWLLGHRIGAFGAVTYHMLLTDGANMPSRIGNEPDRYDEYGNLIYHPLRFDAKSQFDVQSVEFNIGLSLIL